MRTSNVRQQRSRALARPARLLLSPLEQVVSVTIRTVKLTFLSAKMRHAGIGSLLAIACSSALPAQPPQSRAAQNEAMALPLPGNSGESPLAMARASDSSRKNPYVAGGLGLLLPSAGHFYVGDHKRAWAIVGTYIGGAFFALSDGSPTALANAGAVIMLAGWAFSAIDAPLSALRHNRQLERAQ